MCAGVVKYIPFFLCVYDIFQYVHFFMLVLSTTFLLTLIISSYIDMSIDKQKVIKCLVEPHTKNRRGPFDTHTHKINLKMFLLKIIIIHICAVYTCHLVRLTKEGCFERAHTHIYEILILKCTGKISRGFLYNTPMLCTYLSLYLFSVARAI